MIKVSDKLYRGPRPTSSNDIYEIAKVCKTFINLESGVYEHFHNDFYEYFSDRNVMLVRIRCSDIFPPTRLAVERFLAVVTCNFGSYVHCRHGKDRTGFMCAVYRMQVDGWSYKESVAEMFSLGFHKFPYLWWLRELRKYERK